MNVVDMSLGSSAGLATLYFITSILIPGILDMNSNPYGTCIVHTVHSLDSRPATTHLLPHWPLWLWT